VTISASQAESDAMAAFLAKRECGLSERAVLWAAVVELIKSRPQELVEQMEKERNLK
jgi:hypothetical protein